MCILLVVITYNILLETGKEKNILLKRKKTIHNIFASVEFSRRQIGIFRDEDYVVNTSKLSS